MKIWQIALASTTLGFALPALAQMAAKAELRSEVEGKVRERLDRFDANHDGTVTREEIMAFADARMKGREGDEFARMDMNKDGSISRTEFDDFHAKMRSGMRADGMGGDRVMMMRRETAPDPMGSDGKREPRMRMMMMDGRGGDMMMAEGSDRIVIADEVKRAQARFDLMDTNHDASVSPEERRAYRAMKGGAEMPGK